MFPAFLGVLSEAGEVISEKIFLRQKNISGFLLLTGQMVILFFCLLIPYIWLGRIDGAFFTPKYILFFGAIILFGFLHNLFYFYSLSHDTLSNIEPVALLASPTSMIFAALVFTSERNFYVLLFTVIASAALLFSRIEKHHLRITKYSLAMLGHVVFIAIEALFIKEVLLVMSPVALYTFRIGVLAVLIMILLRKPLNRIKKNQYVTLSLISVIIAVEYIAKYYAIGSIGIVKSNLIFLLGPVIILFLSKFLLKEKIGTKKAVADAVIVVCVACATIVG